MKIKTVAVGLAASAAVAGAASADVLINVPDFFLNNGETYTHVEVIGGNLDVIGFSFIGDWAGTGGAWASDTRLEIYRDGVLLHFLGGFPAPGAPNDWDFQGVFSLPDATYGHGIFGAVPFGNGDGLMDPNVTGTRAGTWEFVFTQTWGTADWSNTLIILHQIPAPGAMALLGIAGLAGIRRRRN